MPDAQDKTTPFKSSRSSCRLLVVAAVTLLAVARYFAMEYYLPNFRTVEPGKLYRSGQPREFGLYWLEARGIRTIISLRSANDSKSSAERSFAERHGITFINIPVGTRGYDTETSTQEFLEIVTDSHYWPVLVHCSRGKERTGIMAAAYRMEVDGWSKLDAWNEACATGLDPMRFPSIYAVLETFGGGADKFDEY